MKDLLSRLNIKLLSKKNTKIVKIICLILFISFIIYKAWLCDDSFHSFVMVKNLFSGNGLVYNIGERVNASTEPLFTLLVAFFRLFIKDLYFAGIFTCIVCSSLAFYILVFKLCNKYYEAIIATIILLLSKSFISYTSSGLANPLLFLLGVCYLYVYLKNDTYKKKDLFLISLLCGLIAFTRIDAALIFAIPSIYAFFFKRDKSVSLGKCILIGLAGLLPFFMWEVFSLLYYGFLVPNTAYTKLNSGFPLNAYLVRGIAYFKVSFIYDPFVMIIPLLSLFLIFKNKNIKSSLINFSVLIYFIYIIYIGGDFMVGRYFSLPLLITLSLICFNSNKKINLLLFTTTVVLVLYSLFVYNTQLFDKYKINGAPYDERQMQYHNLGLINNIKSLKQSNKLLLEQVWDSKFPFYDSLTYSNDDIKKLINDGNKSAILNLATGVHIYLNGDKIYLTDYIGLGDPLLSKLPAENTNWMIGHLIRHIPEGYRESLESNTNQITDASLHEYYDKIRIITRDNVFSKKRIKTIIELNTHKYDYLIEDYINKTK